LPASVEATARKLTPSAVTLTVYRVKCVALKVNWDAPTIACNLLQSRARENPRQGVFFRRSRGPPYKNPAPHVGPCPPRPSSGHNARESIMAETTNPASRGKMYWTGWVISGLVGAFLAFSASLKFVAKDMVR
jgi:hypothetical protein